ncbi:MAG: DUF4905 domain-containing protein [Bacteroidota bacterium]|nr:DUF4905 domain-containing protein [Bacteroidota bacterium]
MGFVPFYSQIFDLPIWKIYPNNTKSALCVEFRDASTLSAKFGLLDLSNCSWKWIDIFNANNWWTGVETFHNNIIYFHHYDPTLFSKHLGVIAYHPFENKIKWQLKMATFVKIENDFLWALKLKEEIPVRFDLESGNEIVDQNSAYQIIQEKINCIYPNIFQIGELQFEKIKTFLLNKFTQSIYQSVEYLEFDQLIIISYYTKSDSAITNNLLIINREGSVLLHEKLQQEAKGIGFGTFFIYNRILITIKNTSELLAYEI